jgi:hypothetical protein
MLNTTLPAADAGLPAATATQPHHRLGSRIVVELTGVITSRDSRTCHFAIQPDHPRSSTIHVRPEFIFPEEDAPDAAIASGALPSSAPHSSLLDLEDSISRTIWIVTTLEAAVDGGDICFSSDGRNGLSILLGQARLTASAARDALARLERPSQQAVGITDAGRAAPVTGELAEVKEARELMEAV